MHLGTTVHMCALLDRATLHLRSRTDCVSFRKSKTFVLADAAQLSACDCVKLLVTRVPDRACPPTSRVVAMRVKPSASSKVVSVGIPGSAVCCVQFLCDS